MNKKLKKTKREIKWWEISTGKRKWTKEESMKVEFKEILEQHRWEWKNFPRRYENNCFQKQSQQDWKDFYEKYSDYEM